MTLLALLSTGDAAVVVAVLALLFGTSTGIAMRNRRDIKQINRAVNHVEEGEPTLIQRTRWLEESQQWNVATLQAVARQVGVDTPPPPPPLAKEPQ